jgi:hypothetical protein
MKTRLLNTMMGMTLIAGSALLGFAGVPQGRLEFAAASVKPSEN